MRRMQNDKIVSYLHDRGGMLIVVEGPDGGGKTRLVQRLSFDLNINIEPRVVSKDAEAMVDLQEWVTTDVGKGFGRRLYDRHRLISETIYGPVLRSKIEPGFGNPRWLANQLAKFYWVEPVVIYCLPPFEQVWRNVKDDEDNKVIAKHEVIHTIYSLYAARCGIDMALSKAHTYTWDYVNDEDTGYYDSLLFQIREQLKAKGHG